MEDMPESDLLPKSMIKIREVYILQKKRKGEIWGRRRRREYIFTVLFLCHCSAAKKS